MASGDQDFDQRPVFIFFYVLVAVLGILGNSLVCLVLGTKKHKKDSDVFIISLAVADLMVSMTSPVTYIIYPNYYGISSKRYAAYVWYHINIYLGRMSGTVSSWTLVSIAVERHRAITKPLQSRIAKKTKAVAICCTWALSFLSYLPIYLYTYDVLKVPFTVILYYGIAWASLTIVVPLIALIALYVLCIKALRVASKARRRLSQHYIENTRAVKMFLIIVTLFFLCTMPLTILLKIFVFRGVKSLAEVYMFEILTEFALVLLLVNNCLNPFIYARMHQDINAFMKRSCQRVKSIFSKDSVTPASPATVTVI